MVGPARRNPRLTRFFVIISGLPGCGKTTLARKLAAELGLPMLDKDDILEAMFDAEGSRTPEDRQRLSRAADAELIRKVQASDGAVVVSFWRPESVQRASGTPVAELRALGAPLIEVFCDCPPSLADQRFHNRTRHPGHQDGNRNDWPLSRFEEIARLYPLKMGPVIRADMAKGYDIAEIARGVRAIVQS
jgi:adenylate kinase family enzyme